MGSWEVGGEKILCVFAWFHLVYFLRVELFLRSMAFTRSPPCSGCWAEAWNGRGLCSIASFLKLRLPFQVQGSDERLVGGETVLCFQGALDRLTGETLCLFLGVAEVAVDEVVNHVVHCGGSFLV